MIVKPTATGLEATAPAKLNLFLEVRGKRPDGYHEVETLMVTVDLHDTLTFTPDPSGAVRLACDDPSLPTDAGNLVVRAAERLREATGCRLGVSIHLHKEIPAQAGLGGGSSDAMTTLSALNQLWGLHLPGEALDALAGTLGSDVAFFRHGPAAVGRGRGELIERVPIGSSTPLHFVMINPPVGMGTAEVYRNVKPPDRPNPMGPAVEALRSGDVEALGARLFNRLQPVAEALEPSLGRIRLELERLGPALLPGHLMSGSGSAYFGLALDGDAAQAAAQHLGTLGLGRVRVVTCGP
ncbi:MAG: 4-(cytidine 5'-diphospho)-2-C-methyl-D-erythritol kinase [Isosphaeraceae bacterium]